MLRAQYQTTDKVSNWLVNTVQHSSWIKRWSVSELGNGGVNIGFKGEQKNETIHEG